MDMALGSPPTPPEIRSPEQDRAAEDASAAQGEEEVFDDAFDIPHKNASHGSLLRWRVRDPSLAFSCQIVIYLSSFLVCPGDGIGT